MDLTAGMEMAKTEYDLPLGGFIAVNDDNEMFWHNTRPSLQDGYWGSNTRGFMSEYLGMYTGTLFWTKTLRAI